MNASRSRLLAVFAALGLTPLETRADDWPQRRGPDRDGVRRETGIHDRIPATVSNVRWRARVGTGYSGPVVARERVYDTDHLCTTEVERPMVR